MTAEPIVDVFLVRGVPEGERGLNLYRVEVEGAPPDDYAMSYAIQARTKTLAAKQALQRFAFDILSMSSER